MNRLRCFLFATIVLICTSMLASGGEMQTPGKSDPAPTPTPTSLTSTSTSTTSDDVTQPSDEFQFVWEETTTLLVEILLTVF